MNEPATPATGSPAPLPLSIPGLKWGSSGLQTNDRPAVQWLWHGYLAARNLTLLTSLWKAGKTTLVSVLLHHLHKGGMVAGRELRAGRALVLSEESVDLWRMRAGRLAFGDSIGWLCRPFRGRPCLADWDTLFHVLQDMHRQTGLDLVVVDTLASFFPLRSENEANCMLEALAPLQRLASTGPAVLVLHHPRKGRALIGQSARGHGSLQGACDISLEMYRYRRGHPLDRRRKLHAQSRYNETPARLVIELNAAGTDYTALDAAAELDSSEFWTTLQPVFAAASSKLTRRDLLAAWPEDRRPKPKRLFTWLQEMVAAGQLCQDGRGVRESPFRYWLPGREGTG